MVKKGVFQWIGNGQKNIELRRGKAKKGSTAVFQCVRVIPRRKIMYKEEGNLVGVLANNNYKNIVPSAKTQEGAANYMKKLYGTIEGTFTAYHIEPVGLRD